LLLHSVRPIPTGSPIVISVSPLTGRLGRAALLLFFPAFLIALLQRRWAALPMWLCCIALLAPGLTHPKDMIAASSLRGEIELVGVVLLTELARLIRGAEPEEVH
jgi:hypothetical protein